VTTYSLKNINYEDMRYEFEVFVNTSMSHNASDIISAINWTEWVMVPGPIPEVANVAVNFTNVDELEARSLADYYIDNAG